jgi:hypothetical protein
MKYKIQFFYNSNGQRKKSIENKVNYNLNFARKRQFKGFVAQQIKIIQQWFSTQSHGYLDLNVGPAGNCKF